MDNKFETVEWMKSLSYSLENTILLLKKCGENVKIYPTSKIINPAVISIGDNSMIDDFTFVNGGKSTNIGRYVHIASFSSIIGGGVFELGDFSVLACGSRVLTGTDTYHDGSRMSTALPDSQRNPTVGKVIIGKDAFIGTNSVIHPNVKIGEGAIIGSNSLVISDVPPYTINTGTPCKVVKKRPKISRPDI
ncbi:MAG: acyltransferase [Candidatus Ranarchaeia archaeon]